MEEDAGHVRDEHANAVLQAHLQQERLEERVVARLVVVLVLVVLVQQVQLAHGT